MLCIQWNVKDTALEKPYVWVTAMVLSRIFQSCPFLEVIKVIWHPNRELSCNSRGDGNPAPKSNHTASTLAPPTTPDWHLKVPPEHLDKPLITAYNESRAIRDVKRGQVSPSRNTCTFQTVFDPHF